VLHDKTMFYFINQILILDTHFFVKVRHFERLASWKVTKLTI